MYLMRRIIISLFTISSLITVSCKCENHQIKYEKITPTCQHAGYERYYCTKCGYEKIENLVSQLNCKFTEKSRKKIDSEYIDCLYEVKSICNMCGKEKIQQTIIHYYNNDRFEKYDYDERRYYNGCVYCGHKRYLPTNRLNDIKLYIEMPGDVDYCNTASLLGGDGVHGRYNSIFYNITITSEKDLRLYDIIINIDGRNELSMRNDYVYVGSNIKFEKITDYGEYIRGTPLTTIIESTKIEFFSHVFSLYNSHEERFNYNINHIKFIFIESLK